MYILETDEVVCSQKGFNSYTLTQINRPSGSEQTHKCIKSSDTKVQESGRFKRYIYLNNHLPVDRRLYNDFNDPLYTLKNYELGSSIAKI